MVPLIALQSTKRAELGRAVIGALKHLTHSPANDDGDDTAPDANPGQLHADEHSLPETGSTHSSTVPVVTIDPVPYEIAATEADPQQPTPSAKTNAAALYTQTHVKNQEGNAMMEYSSSSDSASSNNDESNNTPRLAVPGEDTIHVSNSTADLLSLAIQRNASMHSLPASEQDSLASITANCIEECQPETRRGELLYTPATPTSAMSFTDYRHESDDDDEDEYEMPSVADGEDATSKNRHLGQRLHNMLHATHQHVHLPHRHGGKIIDAVAAKDGALTPESSGDSVTDAEESSRAWHRVREYHGDLSSYLQRIHVEHNINERTAWAATESVHVKHLLDEMLGLAQDNAAYFRNKATVKPTFGSRPRAESAERFEMLFFRAHSTVLAIRHDTFSLCWLAPLFDFDEHVKSSGYRSLVRVVMACLSKLAKEMRAFTLSRDSLLFRADASFVVMEDYIKTLELLSAMLNIALRMASLGHSNSVFPGDASLGPLPASTLAAADSLLAEVEGIQCARFYGRKFGFQYSKPMRTTLKVILIAMASYSYGFNNNKSDLAQKVFALASSPLYVFGSEDRARSLSKQLLRGDLAFSKAFWNLTENTMAKHVSKVVSANVSVNFVMKIPVVALTCPADDPSRYPAGGNVHLSVETLTNDGLFDVVHARLISHEWYAGQMYECAHVERGGESESRLFTKAKPMSNALIVHFHGGGFISQSSKSHEIYLREWTRELDCPIVSVDYTLAPDAPYPQALFECLFTYVWALKNAARLGTTAETVILAGDSAGANLCLTVALKCVELGIRRPAAVLACYPPCLIQYWPAASRMLSVMDALLPTAVLKNCLAAYVTGTDKLPTTVTKAERSGPRRTSSKADAVISTDAGEGETVTVSAKTAATAMQAAAESGGANAPSSAGPPAAGWRMDPFISPLVASEEALRRLPPIQIVAAGLDPLLDDSIQFARRLRSVGHPVKLHVFDTLPHGFLSFSKIVDEADAACRFCTRFMAGVFTAGRSRVGTNFAAAMSSAASKGAHGGAGMAAALQRRSATESVVQHNELAPQP
ncbi:hormone-sensitive lipase [Capsaspora owczarzaki ATCC 30864]|uniref:Hormone-sensitive lipase n=1 Tax=Capsaspora owczarzaki (strain ATCC 30864) TaxID=595528 RepID=A0A0D2WM53_CAPO3|nr:hormone-sensitive lipase [Capsaspora owczarzaki ATCC 30864]KJE91855.1 hormone-sensitive lipase [Capsaspora owczarzaki ATCC 30864]|eukprot:XP_004363763.2 hormone-sensitive lipase [Capsaspora owczarzaki ATCC 30864]